MKRSFARAEAQLSRLKVKDPCPLTMYLCEARAPSSLFGLLHCFLREGVGNKFESVLLVARSCFRRSGSLMFLFDVVVPGELTVTSARVKNTFVEIGPMPKDEVGHLFRLGGCAATFMEKEACFGMSEHEGAEGSLQSLGRARHRCLRLRKQGCFGEFLGLSQSHPMDTTHNNLPKQTGCVQAQILSASRFTLTISSTVAEPQHPQAAPCPL